MPKREPKETPYGVKITLTSATFLQINKMFIAYIGCYPFHRQLEIKRQQTISLSAGTCVIVKSS